METANKRISILNYVATLTPKGALILSAPLSRASGHHNPDGVYLSGRECYWDAIYAAAMDIAAAMDSNIEIYATHPKWGTWQVSTVYAD